MSDVPAVTKTAEVMPVPRAGDQDFGRTSEPDAAPDTNMIFTARVKDRWSRYGGTIKPAEVVSALREAENGDLGAQNDLFERMEEQDMALSGILGTRRLATVGLKFSILPRDASEQAKKAADLCRQVVDGISDFHGSRIDIADGIGKGISMLEIDWVNRPDLVSVRALRRIDPKRFVYDRAHEEILIRIDPDAGDTENLFIDAANRVNMMPPPPNKVIAFRSKMRSGHPSRAGLLRVVVLGFLIRNFGYKDWSTYGEVFGMPLRVAKYAPGTGETEKYALLEAVRSLGSDGAAIISTSTELEIKEAINRGVQPYEALVNAMRTEYAIAIVGQEMTNTVSSNGARALGQVQQMVRQDLLEADCEQIMEVVQRDLFRPIVGFNMGWEFAEKVCPIFKLHYEPPADLKTLIEIDKVLFAPKIRGGLALPITKKQMYARYGVEPPPEDAKPDEFLVTEKDEQPPAPAGGPEPIRGRQRNQSGQNHDTRPPADRRVETTRAGSNAATLAKALLSVIRGEEAAEGVEGLLTKLVAEADDEDEQA